MRQAGSAARGAALRDGIVADGETDTSAMGQPVLTVLQHTLSGSFAGLILDGASAGVPLETMGIGPVPATRKVLDRTGLSIADLGAVELNEAFATQSLACIRRLGLDEELVNRDGGAIALGHPLGSSGSRIAVTLLGRMERELSGEARRLGLATMCVGVGQGTAMLLEGV